MFHLDGNFPKIKIYLTFYNNNRYTGVFRFFYYKVLSSEVRNIKVRIPFLLEFYFIQNKLKSLKGKGGKGVKGGKGGKEGKGGKG